MGKYVMRDIKDW